MGRPASREPYARLGISLDVPPVASIFPSRRIFVTIPWHSARQGVSQTVEVIYQRLAPVYDLIYGVTLAPGRRHALTRLAPGHGESILEIGVGTGLSAVEYPRDCRVVAIDLSAAMLERAKVRL